jgi:hypothetical protein
VGASAVEIKGLTQTRGLMLKFEPDLLKRMDATLNAVARDLKGGAQANFAETGAGGNAYRIKTSNRVSGFSKSVTTVPGNVGRGEKWSSEPGVLAAIFETAKGVRDSQPQNVARTKSLIATLTARYGAPGRFLWPAWRDRSAAAKATISAEITALESEYTARLGA